MDIRGNIKSGRIGGTIEPQKITTRTNDYILPVATEDKLGGVKIGENLYMDEDARLNAEEYTLPVATKNTLGGVKVGANLAITSAGTLKAVIPKATSSVLGGIKVGENLEIESDGTLNAVGGGSIKELELDEYEATLYSDLDVGVTYRVSVAGYIANDDDDMMLFEVGSLLCNYEYGFWGLNGEGIFTCYHGGQPLFTGSWWDFLVLTSAEAGAYYQPILVSGRNIKTINSQSLLGNGNIQFKTFNNETLLGNGNIGLKTLNHISLVGDGNIQIEGASDFTPLDVSSVPYLEDLEDFVWYQVIDSGTITSHSSSYIDVEPNSLLFKGEFGAIYLCSTGSYWLNYDGGDWSNSFAISSIEVDSKITENNVQVAADYDYKITQVSNQVSELRTQVNGKEDATTITKLTNATISLALEDNHIYTSQSTLPNSITITSASGLNANNMGVCELLFMTSDVAPSFNYPSGISFEGDGVVDNEFIPEPNCMYDILFAHNGFVVLGTVKGVDLYA